MILAQNSLESLVQNTRNAMNEFGKGLPQDQQVEINGVLNEAEKYVDSEDLETVKAMSDKVQETANKLTEALMAGVS